MNNPIDPTLRELDDCGCCTGITAETPVEIDNRPGLEAIVFRAGNHPQFKATMLAALSSSATPALSSLKTRDANDFTIALLDGWATVADVLTFYSERIANESYLRTAAERASVLELARSIGYELNPGVAASTYLVFTVEDAAGAPGYANIDAGTKVQSVPGPDETPQLFETLDDLYAHKDWNSLPVKSSEFVTPYFGMETLYLKGTTTNLNEGDALLIVGQERENDPGSERWDFRRVKELETFPDDDAEKAYTLVTLDRALGSAKPYVDPAQTNPKVYALRQRAALFGANAAEWKLLPSEVQDVYKDNTTTSAVPSVGVRAAKTTTGGSTSPGLPQRPFAQTDDTWPNFKISDVSDGNGDTIHLDAIYSGIVPDSWIVLSSPSYQEVYRVTAVAEDSPAKFGLTTKSTKLTIEGENLKDKFDDQIRETVVFAQSEELAWAEKPFYDAVFGEEITLDQAVSDLPADRELLVSGLAARVKVRGQELELTLADQTKLALSVGDGLNLTGPPAAQNGTFLWELQKDDGTTGVVLATAEQLEFVAADASNARIFEQATLKRTDVTIDGLTLLVLSAPLTYAYDPATIVVLGNVARATHGETVAREVLGSGNANESNQSFELSQAPLTYIPAATSSGGETTLEIWVNDVKWSEVTTLYGHGPRERIYVTRLADDGTVTVIFGDGASGARLPTGSENIKAVYRKGIGVEALLKAEQLSLLRTRPLGVKAVINPEATEGAADPQVLEDARENAPTTVLTLDRVVSLLDYEDWARNFSGIAKAMANWTWDVHTRGVFLTLAGEEGAAVDSTTQNTLLESFREYGNPLVPVDVRSFTPISFKLAGKVFADADRDPEEVGTAVNDALKAAFSFDARDFGQAVTLSEVEAVIQNVTGVAFVDLDALYVGTTSALKHYLPAKKPRDGASVDAIAPAELLTLDENSLSDLEVRTA
jgi:hypothetical protein